MPYGPVKLYVNGLNVTDSNPLDRHYPAVRLVKEFHDAPKPFSINMLAGISKENILDLTQSAMPKDWKSAITDYNIKFETQAREVVIVRIGSEKITLGFISDQGYREEDLSSMDPMT